MSLVFSLVITIMILEEETLDHQQRRKKINVLITPLPAKKLQSSVIRNGTSRKRSLLLNDKITRICGVSSRQKQHSYVVSHTNHEKRKELLNPQELSHCEIGPRHHYTLQRASWKKDASGFVLG